MFLRLARLWRSRGTRSHPILRRAVRLFKINYDASPQFSALACAYLISTFRQIIAYHTCVIAIAGLGPSRAWRRRRGTWSRFATAHNPVEDPEVS